MARKKPLVTWRAFVKIVGIPEVTADEMAKIADVVPGSVKHTRGHQGGFLWLDWRFQSTTLHAAMDDAGATWRKAVWQIDGKADPECTDFRVMRVFPTKKEKRS